MTPFRSAAGACAFATLFAVLAGCASRAVEVRPQPVPAAQFAGWDCAALDDEAERVQQRAADVAYAVDAHAGNNIIAIGVGSLVFWPALLAMRPDGPEAAELARLKGRYEALRQAAAARGCPPPSETLPPERAAALPVALGERLVYEERGLSGPAREIVLRLSTLKRGELDFALEDGSARGASWRQDASGNALSPYPFHMLAFSHLLHREMALGDVLAGELHGPDPTARTAHLRGQVIAVGGTTVSGHAFDAATIELFGDVPQGQASSTRLEGSMVVDRASGVLLRLELRSGNPEYALRRRLVRIEPARS